MRDLPVWARSAAAGLLLLATWMTARSELIVTAVGAASGEVIAGVVAVSVLLGMRLPLDLWPAAPRRTRFSMVAALGVAFAVGGLILFSEPVEAAAYFVEHAGVGALLAVVVGGAAWSLAWGRTKQRPFGRWYGLAVASAVVPILAALVVIGWQQAGVPTLRPLVFIRETAFFATVGAIGALVTQELAFRRLLIGQSGDAGLVAVLAAALVFGAWHVIIGGPEGEVGLLLVQTVIDGIILGALYMLSRSLLVPALYHGIRSGVVQGTELAVVPQESLDGRLTSPILIASGVLALAFAAAVVRRTGFLGALKLKPVEHAPDD